MFVNGNKNKLTWSMMDSFSVKILIIRLMAASVDKIFKTAVFSASLLYVVYQMIRPKLC